MSGTERRRWHGGYTARICMHEITNSLMRYCVIYMEREGASMRKLSTNACQNGRKGHVNLSAARCMYAIHGGGASEGGGRG